MAEDEKTSERRGRLVAALIVGMLLAGSADVWDRFGVPLAALAQAFLAVGLLFWVFLRFWRLEHGPE